MLRDIALELAGAVRRQVMRTDLSFPPEPAARKFARVHALVRRIPRGRVTTYGRLARAVTAAGYPLSARAAGWALRHCPAGVPWHRVVSADGSLAAELRGGAPEGRQRELLRREGAAFDQRSRVRLERCLWEPSEADAGDFPEEAGARSAARFGG